MNEFPLTNAELASAIHKAAESRGSWHGSYGHNPWPDHLRALLEIQRKRAEIVVQAPFVQTGEWREVKPDSV
jgi:hypothetical protein